MKPFSWVPDDLVDPQNMVKHPFGIWHRKGGGHEWHRPWETTWYWRRYYLAFHNIFHPQFWRDMFQPGNRQDRWRSTRFFLRTAIRAGRDR